MMVDHLKAPVGDRGRGVLFGDAGSGAGSRAAAVIDRHRRMPLEQPRSKKAESGQRGARTRIGNLNDIAESIYSEFDNPKGCRSRRTAPPAWRAVQKSMQPRRQLQPLRRLFGDAQVGVLPGCRGSRARPRSLVMSRFFCSASRSGQRWGRDSSPVNSQPKRSAGCFQDGAAISASFWFLGSRYHCTMRSVSSMKSTMAARFLSRNGLRAVHTIISVTPIASRWV